ncbi:hypothetical protein C1H46_023816 [Malus baccata]|uniref:Geranylgeranyl transferase type-2 subunit beta n=1 Tax=Malus baccata TaxID=106549 RepID=A0A540LWG7_MALBA|nr:hypothetical protein C1H46_023816 [Malus baccata]
MEHPRMNGEYWCLTILDLLGKLQAVDVDEVVSWVLHCQHDSSGFEGNIGHEPHVQYTLSAVQVWPYLTRLMFWMLTRFSYIAISCLSLLHRLDKISVEKAVNYSVTCKNHDGGFGCTPGGKSHAGQIFCCVGALAVMGSLHRIDKTFLGGGYVSSKLILETFLTKQKLNLAALMAIWYSWWVLSSLVIIDRVHWIGKEKLVKFVLDCQDIENGGISDRPDDTVDVYHTYFAVAALTFLDVMVDGWLELLSFQLHPKELLGSAYDWDKISNDYMR